VQTLKPYCQGLLQIISALERFIVAADVIAYAFVGVSLSDTVFMRGEDLHESCKVIYSRAHLKQPVLSEVLYNLTTLDNNIHKHTGMDTNS